MPRYNFNYGSLGGEEFARAIQPGIDSLAKSLSRDDDEITKKETMLGQQLDRRIKAINASDTWFEKAFKDREDGNSSPEMFMGQIQTAMDMSATGGRDLSKYNLDVSNFAKFSDLKAKLKTADSTELANAYKTFLNSEKQEDKIENAVVLGKVFSAYQQKYKPPIGSYKFIEDVLEKFNTVKFAQPEKERPYKIGQRLPAREEGNQNVVDMVVGYDNEGIPITKPISRGARFKPEDTTDREERRQMRNQQYEEQRQMRNQQYEDKMLIKKQEKISNLDKWFAAEVKKAGGRFEPTPEGGVQFVKIGWGAGLAGNDDKLKSIKTTYDKMLKDIEKSYERAQAVAAIKARPDLAKRIKAMFKQETGEAF